MAAVTSFENQELPYSSFTYLPTIDNLVPRAFLPPRRGRAGKEINFFATPHDEPSMKDQLRSKPEARDDFRWHHLKADKLNDEYVLFWNRLLHT